MTIETIIEIMKNKHGSIKRIGNKCELYNSGKYIADVSCKLWDCLKSKYDVNISSVDGIETMELK